MVRGAPSERSSESEKEKAGSTQSGRLRQIKHVLVRLLQFYRRNASFARVRLSSCIMCTSFPTPHHLHRDSRNRWHEAEIMLTASYEAEPDTTVCFQLLTRNTGS